MPTLEQLKREHETAVSANEALGIVTYETPGQPQSDQIWQVTEGLKYLPGGKALGPGHRFHPTEAQVANGSLRNKARELTGTEYAGVRSGRLFSGVDFKAMEAAAKPAGPAAHPLANILFTEAAGKMAADMGLVAADFAGIEPDGAEGKYTKPQVEAIIEAKTAADVE